MPETVTAPMTSARVRDAVAGLRAVYVPVMPDLHADPYQALDVAEALADLLAQSAEALALLEKCGYHDGADDVDLVVAPLRALVELLETTLGGPRG